MGVINGIFGLGAQQGAGGQAQAQSGTAACGMGQAGQIITYNGQAPYYQNQLANQQGIQSGAAIQMQQAMQQNAMLGGVITGTTAVNFPVFTPEQLADIKKQLIERWKGMDPRDRELYINALRVEAIHKHLYQQNPAASVVRSGFGGALFSEIPLKDLEEAHADDLMEKVVLQDERS